MSVIVQMVLVLNFDMWLILVMVLIFHEMLMFGFDELLVKYRKLGQIKNECYMFGSDLVPVSVYLNLDG